MEDKNKAIQEFWDNYVIANPSNVTKVLPDSLYDGSLSTRKKRIEVVVANVAESYEAVATECRNKVNKIAADCRAKNEKFTDEEFMLDSPLFCNKGLKLAVKMNSDDFNAEEEEIDFPDIESIHRVGWIFEKPAFSIDGFSKSDVKQGCLGDCWFIAAMSCVSSKPELVEKICVARDEEVGVYGFVFFRDGEWVSVVIDDFLYGKEPDYDESLSSVMTEKVWKKHMQTGSSALYYAKCTNPNETWVPLLEKAFAKLNGDYEAIEGGLTSEGIVDLTGGTVMFIETRNILNVDNLWKELLQVNDKFLFSCAFKQYSKGVTDGHAYSILKTVEAEDEEGNIIRFVLVRNPHANDFEWTGPWSDGSKEWTPYWMSKLDHTFGDDGEFWMKYEDLIHYAEVIDRTRLYDETWSIAQKWTSVKVPWLPQYLPTKFVVEFSEAGTVVFVLTQLDKRCFKGLQGRYYFGIAYIVRKEGSELDDYILSVPLVTYNNRAKSSGEIEIEPGRYEVLLKITAYEIDNPEPLALVQSATEKAPAKLKQIGANYDYAHSILGDEKIEEDDEEDDEKEDADEGDEDDEKEDDDEGEGEEKPCWDPVAVIGLRVFAQDSAMNITVVK